MIFNKINISNFRNIREAAICPTTQFNVLFGDNGSGKTSFLEVLYYLAHGRSFRSHLVQRIINHDAQSMVLFSDLTDQAGQIIPVGIMRDVDKDCKIHIQQKPVKSAAELAVLLPVLLINPDSFDLLDSGPSHRRALIDWVLFHVEHCYHSVWSRFQRCLKQRNAALRQQFPVAQITVWDEEFVNLSLEIDRLRVDYSARMSALFLSVMHDILPLEALSVHYQPGWHPEKKLAELLETHLQQDRERGYTYYGPQRADLVLKSKHIPLHDILSRGQQKLVVCALRIAQAQLLMQTMGKSCVFLLDDLPAELGENYRQYLLTQLQSLKTQVFITALEQAALRPLLQEKDVKMFHVEQGEIKKK